MGFFRRMLLLQASSWVSSSPSPQDAKHLETSAGPSLTEQPLEDVALELSVDHGHLMALPGMEVLHGIVSPHQRMRKLDCAQMDFIAAVVYALPHAQHQQLPLQQQQQPQPQPPQQNNVLPKAEKLVIRRELLDMTQQSCVVNPIPVRPFSLALENVQEQIFQKDLNAGV